MRPTIQLGRIFGIRIGLHYSWFIIAFLIVISLAGRFQAENPQWGGTVIWALAGMTAVLFFASIVAHELSHAAVAIRQGMPVRSITLFALGGVANVEEESADAKSEFWMAVAGPAASVAIGLFFLGLARALGWHPSWTVSAPLPAGFLWLGYINLFLALFNMVPGFPMDGGRILRSIVWSVTGDIVRATRAAAHVGQFIAGGFILFGFLRFFGGAGLGGLWIAFIGWFLMDAAGSTITQVEMTRALSGVRVRDLMSRDCPIVDGNLNLRIFAEDYLLPTGRRCFLVRHDGRNAGVVTAAELKNTARERWPFTTVEQVMRSFDRIRAASPDMSVEQAVEAMQRQELNLLPVLSNGEVVGVLSRDRVMEFLQTQAELKAA